MPHRLREGVAGGFRSCPDVSGLPDEPDACDAPTASAGSFSKAITSGPAPTRTEGGTHVTAAISSGPKSGWPKDR
jgi:hypothetical protein